MKVCRDDDGATKVNVGGVEELDIVCGAPNVAAGQKVLVATVGTTLYADDGTSFKIKKDPSKDRTFLCGNNLRFLNLVMLLILNMNPMEIGFDEYKSPIFHEGVKFSIFHQFPPTQ